MPPQNVRKKLITQKWFITLCIICTVILLTVVTFTILSNNEKNKALAYLDAKYGQTFVVKSQRIYPPFVFSSWQMDLVVSLANDPSVEFTYSKIVFGDDVGKVLVENYLGTAWKYQAADGLKQFLGSVYGVNNVPKYSSSYSAYSHFLTQYNGGKTINLQEAIKKYGNDIGTGSLEITVRSDNPKLSINDQSEKFLELVPYIKASNLPYMEIYYEIKSNSGQTEYKCELTAVQTKVVNLEDVINCFNGVKYAKHDN